VAISWQRGLKPTGIMVQSRGKLEFSRFKPESGLILQNFKLPSPLADAKPG
jgi:hypothetical protein